MTLHFAWPTNRVCGCFTAFSFRERQRPAATMGVSHFQAHRKGKTPSSIDLLLVCARVAGDACKREFQTEVCVRCGCFWQTYWYNPDTKETTWFHPVTNQPSVRILALLNRVTFLLCSRTNHCPLSSHLDRQRIRSRCTFRITNGLCRQGGDGGQASKQGGTGGSIGAGMPPSGYKRSASLPSRPGAQKCSHFLKTGECKFGETCRYDHPAHEAGSDPTGGGRFTGPGPVREGDSATSGLPLRPSERECTFFMKTGACKFGEGCRWHHPPERQSDMGMAAMMKMSSGGPGL